MNGLRVESCQWRTVLSSALAPVVVYPGVPSAETQQILPWGHVAMPTVRDEYPAPKCEGVLRSIALLPVYLSN